MSGVVLETKDTEQRSLQTLTRPFPHPALMVSKGLCSGAASSGLAFLGPYESPELAHLAFWELEATGQCPRTRSFDPSLWKEAEDTSNCPGLLALDSALPMRTAQIDRLTRPLKRRRLCSTPERGHILERILVSLWSLMAWETAHWS